MTPAVQDILDTAAGMYLVEPAALLGRSRRQSVHRARATAMAELRSRGWSLHEIAHLFGRDHSTVFTTLKRWKGGGT